MTSINLLNSLNDIEIVKDKSVQVILGKGSSGIVYLVKHRSNKKLYALKHIFLTNDINFEKIKLEIINLQKIKHPNVISLYSYLKIKNNFYLLFEYLVNNSLFSYLKKNKLEINEKIIIFKKICKGVKVLHKNDIIHRDIKPENILLDEELNPKITDFGLAINSKDTRNTLCGTPQYMAPEILENKEYDNKIDIWALGILLYELVVGHSPFYNINNAILIYNIIKKNEIDYTLITDTKIKVLLKKILNNNPKKRPTVIEILDDELFKNNTTDSNLEEIEKSFNIKCNINNTSDDNEEDLITNNILSNNNYYLKNNIKPKKNIPKNNEPKKNDTIKIYNNKHKKYFSQLDNININLASTPKKKNQNEEKKFNNCMNNIFKKPTNIRKNKSKYKGMLSQNLDIITTKILEKNKRKSSKYNN